MRTAAVIALLASALVWPAAARAQNDPAPTLRRAGDDELARALGNREFAKAVTLLEAQRKSRPKDPFVRYNLACARSMNGEAAAASGDLLDALSLGFVDLWHMERDPHLGPLRSTPTYARIIAGWRELLDARARSDFDSARTALGSGYTSDQDRDARLNYLSAFEPDSFVQAREQVGRVRRWASANLPGMFDAPPDRPDAWALVILPTPADFEGLVGMWGVGGIYDKDRKTLVTQDIGPSLRHEAFHVFHWRHMDRLGQQHPYWIMEGLASLLEDVDQTPAGELILRPSWRTNIAKRLERAGRLATWRELAQMDRRQFTGDRARAAYAQARALLMYVHERGVLPEWYRLYVAGYAQDPGGTESLARALGAPGPQAERAYRAWLRALPAVAEQSRPAQATLGVRAGPGPGDGVEVLEVLVIPGGGGERLRRRDVITSIDQREVRTLDDLQRVMGDMEVGRRVMVAVRRGARRLEVPVVLVEPAPGSELIP